MNDIRLEPQYFGCLHHFSLIAKAGKVFLDAAAPYRKMSFRNRCVIAGSNGTVSLSVPVKGGRNNRSATDRIEIQYEEDWQPRHWKTLRSAYAKAPFFDHYAEEVAAIIKADDATLLEKNLRAYRWACSVLKLPVPGIWTGSGPAGLTNGSDECLPNNYATFSPTPPYLQNFCPKLGFLPNLSILDLIFCEGPNAKTLLL